jgi:hypothetical protein
MKFIPGFKASDGIDGFGKVVESVKPVTEPFAEPVEAGKSTLSNRKRPLDKLGARKLKKLRGPIIIRGH